MKKNPYNFKEWTANPQELKTWSKADYFLGRDEIVMSSRNIFSLQPMHSAHTVMCKCVLYAMFDLLEAHPQRNNFTMYEIKKQISKKRVLYKQLLFLKIEFVNRNIAYAKYKNNVNPYYDWEAKAQRTIEKSKNRIKYRPSNMYILYAGIFLLLDTFLNHTNVKAKQDDRYNTINTRTNRFYSLTKDGEELRRLVKEEKYVL